MQCAYIAYFKYVNVQNLWFWGASVWLLAISYLSYAQARANPSPAESREASGRTVTPACAGRSNLLCHNWITWMRSPVRRTQTRWRQAPSHSNGRNTSGFQTAHTAMCVSLFFHIQVCVFHILTFILTCNYTYSYVRVSLHQDPEQAMSIVFGGYK